MVIALSVLHVLVAIALIISILLQSGKGGGLAGTLGGTTGASSIFGGRGAGDFLVKVTAGLGIAFVVLTILINVLITKPTVMSKSIISDEAKKQIPVSSTGGLPATLPPEEEDY